MDKLIAKIITKYFEHLLKNKWMKKIIEIPIDKQKELLSTIHDEINVLVSDILLIFENHIELTKEIIEDIIEDSIEEEDNENVWENNNE